MVKFKFGLCSFMFGLMLGVAPAWADVDISGKERVEVGTWSELKAAVEDSQNAGKVIVLTGNIQADKNNPIATVAGAGIIIDGGGFTITGQEGSSNGQFIYFKSDTTDLIIQNVKIEGFGNVQTGGYDFAYGGAIYNDKGTIGDISGDFSGNYVQGKYANGGAIYNYRSIGDITGDFSKNYAKSDSGSAIGGAIYNFEGIIGGITGDFSGNYAKSDSGSDYGGAIYNNGTIGDISGDFSNNYAKSDLGSAYGGAIYTHGTIGDITGNFEGNYAQGQYAAYGGAIYNDFGAIGDITGDFSGNYAISTSANAKGGAIYNYSGAIGNITGDFEGNYVKSDSGSASGGAIYNSGTMTLVNSSFYDNYVQTGAEKDSTNGQQTLGGAIYSTSDLTIKADGGESIFRGNKVKWANGEEDSSGIYLGKPTVNLTLDSRNNGLIQFDDKIISRAEIDDVCSKICKCKYYKRW